MKASLCHIFSLFLWSIYRITEGINIKKNLSNQYLIQFWHVGMHVRHSNDRKKRTKPKTFLVSFILTIQTLTVLCRYVHGHHPFSPWSNSLLHSPIILCHVFPLELLSFFLVELELLSSQPFDWSLILFLLIFLALCGFNFLVINSFH